MNLSKMVAMEVDAEGVDHKQTFAQCVKWALVQKLLAEKVVPMD